jgi:monoamine oxidase
MKYNTIIIGAGISGLTIGAGLENPDFIILEARDRIGGRVYTNSDTHLDMGAAWIHGSIDNPLNQFLNYDENMIPVAPSNPWIHSEDASIQYLTTSGEISEIERHKMALQWQEMVKHIANVDSHMTAHYIPQHSYQT